MAAAGGNIPVIRFEETSDSWQVEKFNKGFEVSGGKIERFAKRTDFNSEDSVKRLRDIMKKTGILRELARQGAEPGAIISIAGRWTLLY
jgi:GTP-binding protein